MHVMIGVQGWIQMNDQRQIHNVETARRDVRREQIWQRPSLNRASVAARRCLSASPYSVSTEKPSYFSFAS